MKATGIVRRIDDLGRVVIPKEIRRTLRLREADPLEIFTDKDGEIILKKYSPIGDLGGAAKELMEAIASTTGFLCMVCDQDQIVVASGKKSKDFMEKNISKDLETLIRDRKKVLAEEKKTFRISEAGDATGQIAVPIVSAGDVVGAVILASDEKKESPGAVEERLLETAAAYLGKMMED
ncbi:MAG: stage V sporulation T C-terminal domain-containing protein [Hespellia sp.]|nr:stage V sporulation T C-terminal domain-containing protein [Hespellia sp.]